MSRVPFYFFPEPQLPQQPQQPQQPQPQQPQQPQQQQQQQNAPFLPSLPPSQFPFLMASPFTPTYTYSQYPSAQSMLTQPSSFLVNDYTSQIQLPPPAASAPSNAFGASAIRPLSKIPVPYGSHLADLPASSAFPQQRIPVITPPVSLPGIFVRPSSDFQQNAVQTTIGSSPQFALPQTPTFLPRMQLPSWQPPQPPQPQLQSLPPQRQEKPAGKRPRGLQRTDSEATQQKNPWVIALSSMLEKNAASTPQSRVQGSSSGSISAAGLPAQQSPPSSAIFKQLHSLAAALRVTNSFHSSCTQLMQLLGGTPQSLVLENKESLFECLRV